MDNLDVLLRELQKTIDNNGSIIFSEQSKKLKVQYIFYPTSAKYDLEGLCIEDKDGYYFWITEPDDFELAMDDLDDCLEFSFRSKKDERYYGICF